MKNDPHIWMDKLPVPKESDHKYSRGQVAVLGGADMSGAACLSADAAARVGAGLVTIISPDEVSLHVYRCFKPYIIARNDLDIIEFVRLAKLKGRLCPAIGMGIGNKDYKTLRSVILSLLDECNEIIIDADGLNAFESHTDLLFSKLHKNAVLTPHEGEFKKIFPDLTAKQAAVASNAVIVLKGHETIIASPDGEVIVNDNASPYLATAGSGDVLSGVITGLIAQGMSAFDAACAGVYMHGRASQIIGAGLLASDLIEVFPKVLKEMLGIRKNLG